MFSPDLLDGQLVDSDLVVSDSAMATRITIKFPGSIGAGEGCDALESAIASALEVFHEVDRSCTRFDPESPLMRANRSPRRWHHVPDTLFRTLIEAKRAYDTTAGRFDPRVLRHLVALGYDRTLAFHDGDVRLENIVRPIGRIRRDSWNPGLRYGTREVMLGDEPVDLGGIGKGLAVRWSSAVLKAAASDFLIEAGGDCYCSGSHEDGLPWSIGVEDPFRDDEPICVLSLTDRAVTTSSVRLRSWRLDNKKVHHLIDPATGRPGGAGLLAVTVVGKDPALAEVWSKALFLNGRARIASAARHEAIAALWVDEQGSLETSPAMERYVQWRRN